IKRPAASFEEELIVVHGTDLHKHHSFPSGHTTAAFCMFGFLALSMRSRAWKVCGILVGVSVGLSRMFLGQHYPEDVLAGAILGTVVVTLVYRLTIAVTGGELLNKRLINAK
ncbi:phosphatase PAP2 family protein, partial [bacterium]|nr:phosphatase PAP2 family protein [bacterium]